MGKKQKKKTARAAAEQQVAATPQQNTSITTEETPGCTVSEERPQQEHENLHGETSILIKKDDDQIVSPMTKNEEEEDETKEELESTSAPTSEETAQLVVVISPPIATTSSTTPTVIISPKPHSTSSFTSKLAPLPPPPPSAPLAPSSSPSSLPLPPPPPPPPPPFPLLKVVTVCIINLMNTASYLMTYPFVNFMILSFSPGLSETEVGFYSGTLEGSFHIGSLFGAIFWGWFSDRWGRRPSLLLGLLGTVAATVAFGLSTNFWMAMAARIAWGLLNGNVGVAKTVMSEVVPDCHSARAFAYIGLNTGFGRIIGPALGGIFSEPFRKYGWEGGPLKPFVTFPYLLPCLAAAIMTACTAVLAYITLQETLHLSLAEAAANKKTKMENLVVASRKMRENMQRKKKVQKQKQRAATQQAVVVVVDVEDDEDDDEIDRYHNKKNGHETAKLIQKEESDDDDNKETDSEEEENTSMTSSTNHNNNNNPPSSSSPTTTSLDEESFFSSMRRLWKDNAVFSSTTLYALLGLVGLVSNELLPIYLLNDPSHGGFSLDSSDLGFIAFTAGPLLVVFQAFGFEKAVHKFGLLRVQRFMLSLFAIMLVTTPLQSLFVYSSKEVIWAVLLIHFNVTTLCRVASFICCFIIVANSALPEDRGKVNGLGQAVVSLVRAVGPPIWTSLFAWTVTSPVAASLGWPFDYSFAWYTQAILALVTVWWTYKLPPWIEKKRIEKQ